MNILLEDVYKKAVTFLNEEKYKYLIIGGIAAGVIGEPRVTADVDVDIIISRENVPVFLDKAKKSGFKFIKTRCLESAERTGVFQINYADFHIDFIVASTEIEIKAFERAKTRTLYGVKAFFPTPEDMILLKIIPGRDKDLLDAKNIALRHKGKLDTRYLKDWATKLCDEAQDMRICNILNGLLRD
ncbi:MAG: nucleotidyltransferase [Sedimentisphaerales bacterium]|nr:nucleotidyltransferase [Sedimentisphaerales bacterium]